MRQKQHLYALTLTWSRDNSAINMSSWKGPFQTGIGKSWVGLIKLFFFKMNETMRMLKECCSNWREKGACGLLEHWRLLNYPSKWSHGIKYPEHPSDRLIGSSKQPAPLVQAPSAPSGRRNPSEKRQRSTCPTVIDPSTPKWCRVRKVSGLQPLPLVPSSCPSELSLAQPPPCSPTRQLQSAVTSHQTSSSCSQPR